MGVESSIECSRAVGVFNGAGSSGNEFLSCFCLNFDYLGFLQEFQMFSQLNFEGLYSAPPRS